MGAAVTAAFEHKQRSSCVCLTALLSKSGQTWSAEDDLNCPYYVCAREMDHAFEILNFPKEDNRMHFKNTQNIEQSIMLHNFPIRAEQPK